MAINEQLKFTWGHIIAFLAIIILSYFSFMGIAYLTKGNYIFSGIGVLVIDLFLVLYFIVPQLLKGTDRKFDKKIRFERLLIFTAPVIFIVLMIPYSHFWTVHNDEDTIQLVFKESVKHSTEMFESYERYAEKRINDYTPHYGLSRESSSNLNSASIRMGNQQLKKEALRIQLLSENYHNLKTSALTWIEGAASSSVWNVFILGNISKIENAIISWNKELVAFSENIMNDESNSAVAFDMPSASAESAKDALSQLRKIYTNIGAPTVIAILLGVLFYLMLLLPYIIQSRNTKNHNRLIGSKKESKNHDDLDLDIELEDDIQPESSEKFNEIVISDTKTKNNSDYKSFTI